MLLINTAQEVRQGAAATESFRNEMVQASEKALETHIALANLQKGPQIISFDDKS